MVLLHRRLVLAVATAALLGCARSAPTARASSSPPASGYDAPLAERLGADEHGMRPYVLALLKRGPKRDQPAEEAERLQKAHLQNIDRLAKAKKLVLAGPFLDEGDVRGLYVFDVATIAEAEQLVASDPAIGAGRLVMELHPWYGSASLRELDALHRRITRKSPAD